MPDPVPILARLRPESPRSPSRRRRQTDKTSTALSSTIPRVIRLRQSLETGLRHPLFGPFLLLFLALILAFVVFHSVEHGVEGLLFSCAILAAVTLRLVVILGRTQRTTLDPVPLPGRGPPDRWFGCVTANGPPVRLALPLRL